MICAWQEFLGILPPWIRSQMDYNAKEKLQELRLRIGQQPVLCEGTYWRCISGIVSDADLSFCVNTASHYSPWASQSTASGYITAPGGHRIGICGEAVTDGTSMSGFRSILSLCIRIARDIPGIGKNAAKYRGSMLIIGPPGSGKTTLIRDIIRARSLNENISVVDERCELFPATWIDGVRADVLYGCPKHIGILNLLKTMGPDTIAVDEITSDKDCDALLQAAMCGVSVLATAHAHDLTDLHKRPLYRKLGEYRIFDHLLVLHPDKSWLIEEIAA